MAATRTGAKIAGDTPQPTGGWREALSSTTIATTTDAGAAAVIAAVGGAPQQRGVARRKPGRGDPTLSMCCSDKLCAWGAVGPQGAALSGFLSVRYSISSFCSHYFASLRRPRVARGCRPTSDRTKQRGCA